MRKIFGLIVVALLASTTYAGADIGVGFHYRGHSHHGGFYPHYYGYYGPSYSWYPFYSSIGVYDPYTDVRCEVKPKDASVFVDGYYAGIVDDYDGFFQRLKITPGSHTITFRKPGFAPYSVSLYGAPGSDVHIKQEMIPGDDKLPDDARMQQRNKFQGPGHSVPPGSYTSEIENDDRQQTQMTTSESQVQPRTPQAIAGQGRLRMSITQTNASVYIDGNFWGVIRDAGSNTVGLSIGNHKIEVVKPGFQTFRQDVSIVEGQDVVLDVVMVPEHG